MPGADRLRDVGYGLSLKIVGEADSFWCGRCCADLAGAIGLGGKAQGEIAIAVSELVTNALKFAGGGTLTARRIGAPRVGIEVVVEDDGPGIPDPDAARIDGFSEGRVLAPEDYAHRTRGLGAGLGAVQRLMDEVVIEPRPGGGTRVVARKLVGPSADRGAGLR
jgi:serine/threonine-protein kinase RsbT